MCFAMLSAKQYIMKLVHWYEICNASLIGWPLWNIFITNDHWYVPLVENTSRSFPHAWCITWFLAPEFTPGFNYGSCYLIFSFIFMLCISLFVLLYFFFWPFCCLFFFDIRILITPLVSSNSSYKDNKRP